MNQPNALRLANELIDLWDSGFFEREDVEQAAAELRRLHESTQAMLEALKSASGDLYRASSYCNTYEVLGLVNDAIAKGEQA